MLQHMLLHVMTHVCHAVTHVLHVATHILHVMTHVKPLEAAPALACGRRGSVWI